MENENLELEVQEQPKTKKVKAKKPQPDLSLVGKKVYLANTIETVPVYPLDKELTEGNECGMLKPKYFNGLEFKILDCPYLGVVTIQSYNYGKVNILLDKHIVK